MIVASFLIRLEPFTQHFLKLQVGCENITITIASYHVTSIAMKPRAVYSGIVCISYLNNLSLSNQLIHVHTHTHTQGGHFDLPDRLFHSVPDAWRSASESNMADIKELIPEFFYLPEFLLNSNRFDLGQL